MLLKAVALFAVKSNPIFANSLVCVEGARALNFDSIFLSCVHELALRNEGVELPCTETILFYKTIPSWYHGRWLLCNIVSGSQDGYSGIVSIIVYHYIHSLQMPRVVHVLQTLFSVTMTCVFLTIGCVIMTMIVEIIPMKETDVVSIQYICFMKC